MIEQAAEGDDRARYRVRQQLTAARGAMNGLMAQLIEERLEGHVLHCTTTSKRKEGADELLKVLSSFTR